MQLELKGNFIDKNAGIYLTDSNGKHHVASISKKWFNMSALLGKEDYVLRIAPNVDVALMVMMCIALDERTRDKDD
jgi:uncharacterized protein YxjI